MEEQLVVLVDPWQDKYDRLLEANEKLQKLNQTLEDKLLKLAEKNHAETSGLSEQIQDLTQRLVDARLYIHQLADENDRYRNDINVVIQLLQCKPSNFISPKIETLPEDLQRKILGIKNGVGSGGTRKEKKIIKVQVPTFPPTDIMYAVDKGKGKKNGDKDIVSAAIMAKVLQERENERKENRRNNCHCRYRVALPTVEKSCQTMPSCTISYSEFEFYTSEPDDEEEDEDGVDEEDAESIVNQHSDTDMLRPLNVRSASSPGGARSVGRHTPQFLHSQPPRRPNSWLSGTGRPPGGAVPVRTTLTTTFDEIIQTSREEEARLPTPLFDGRLRHRNQSSASSSSRNQHNHHNHNDNQDQSLSSLTSSVTNGEQFNNHLAHHHSHHHHHHHHHPGNGHGEHHSASLFINNASDTNSIMTAAASNGNVSSSCRDTPPSLQRSSSSSLSSPSSGLPPLSIPTSASITTDLNGDIMMSMSSSSSGNATSSNSSHVMSSACNTPSSCSNASTSGIGGGGSVSGIFHEPLAISSNTSSNVSNPANTRPVSTSNYNNGGGSISISSSSINSNSSSSFSSNNTSSNNPTNSVATLRKGARLSTSHISNVCANGSITSPSLTTTSSAAATSGPGSYGLTRSTSWTRDKVEQVGNGTVSGTVTGSGSTPTSGGGLGLMTSLGNHWRSTVLVHNPPRSHSSYEPLSLVSVQGDGIGGQQTTFSATLSPKSAAVPSPNSNNPASPPGVVDSSIAHNNDYATECNSDSEQPLLQQSLHQPHQHQYSQPPPTYLFHAYHNPQTSGNSGGSGGFFGGVSTAIGSVSTNVGYTNTSNNSSSNTISNSNQYYRAQKRTFWARSSSTTSTETEI